MSNLGPVLPPVPPRVTRRRFMRAYHRTLRKRMRERWQGWGTCSFYQEGIERSLAWQETLARLFDTPSHGSGP